MQQRDQSLDALRGFAILTMILSGSIAFGGVLPAWMYHAQVPPPNHVFDPSIPGITWVDLVFPFFLFSMGAAIPLSLQKFSHDPHAWKQVWWTATRRFLLLTWFALFTYHMRAWVIAGQPNAVDHLLSIGAFVLLFFQLYDPPKERKPGWYPVVKIIAYGLAIAALFVLPFHQGKGFDFHKSDIIILVLGNMAFFGTLIWWYTRHLPWLRLGILPFVMAIFLGSKLTGTWNEWVMNASIVPWMYKFYYLKYLFIIIPGTFAGEWLMADKTSYSSKNQSLFIWLPILLVIVNLILLLNRILILNVAISLGICALLMGSCRKETVKHNSRFQFVLAGSYLLLLGLFFEAFEGGIKKDPSTYSYYFVTSGLAFFMLVSFRALASSAGGTTIIHYLSANGRNPMVAYVAGNLLLMPLLQLTKGSELLNLLNANAWTGFLKGLIFTGIVSAITIFFTSKKWFWKT
jgi:predicted acyltransferase